MRSGASEVIELVGSRFGADARGDGVPVLGARVGPGVCGGSGGGVAVGPVCGGATVCVSCDVAGGVGDSESPVQAIATSNKVENRIRNGVIPLMAPPYSGSRPD